MSDETTSVAAGQLRQYVERIEQLDAEAADVKETRKDALAEMKGAGFDTKILLKIVALRKRTADDIAEEESILDLYRSALGMA